MSDIDDMVERVQAEMTIAGFTFSLSVAALPQGCAHLFPEQGCADVFRQSADLPSAAVLAASSALASAAQQFREEFEASLSNVLKRELGEVAP